jgi:hypothetical protein
MLALGDERGVRWRRQAVAVDYCPGHADGTRVVHLTARSFLFEALCGETVGVDGEPDVAVICEDCHALAVGAGGDPASWVVLQVVELRAAA